MFFHSILLPLGLPQIEATPKIKIAAEQITIILLLIGTSSQKIQKSKE